MPEKHRVGPLEDLPEDEGFRVQVGESGIAIFRRGHRVWAVEDSCPHMGASLSEGYLDGESVVCPWHGWVFQLDDGTSVFDPDSRVDVYRITVEDGIVFVELSGRGSPDACSDCVRGGND